MNAWKCCAVIAVAVACVDVTQGEHGLYGSPCAQFGKLLLCDRETGGADPRPGAGGVEPATCESVCSQLAACGLVDGNELSECLGDCRGFPQTTLDCIAAAGCDFSAISACLGLVGGDD